MQPTYCKDCKHVHPNSAKHVRSWLCAKFPCLEGNGFVDPDWWAENEPFNRCVNINKGFCPVFEGKE